MPIRKNWSLATVHHIQNNVPESGGVYELKTFGELKYIGKADYNLRERLLDHLRKRNPNYYRFATAGFFTSASSLERKHLKAFGRTENELPSWNNRRPW